MSSGASAPLFSAGLPESQPRPVGAWILAACLVLLLVGGGVAATLRRPPIAANVLQPLDPLASELVFSDLKMSESSSVSGLKTTFVDGDVKNAGMKAVRGVTLQVLFSNAVQMPPQMVVTPLNLIRTHQPYIDTQSLDATPLAPGETREFRLAFENLSSDWDQSIPALRVIHVTTQ